MEECESLDSEMRELQEFQCEASEAISQDDEDEVEELQNSLREVVQDPSVKPKLQCLMVDPSFSMVTVQSEDSGIVWETASSRCSTPWASETSSISEAYSMEGSGAAGKITIVFDEDKIVRRRTRSGGRSSRLGDRLSRPGSSRSASALGVERPEMAEVSLPNVKQEKLETESDLEEIKNKDQRLFSLISDGYEILNIRVPSKLPTVDEEESTELQDNLSYLDQTPKIRSRNHHDWTEHQNHVLPEEEEILDHQEPSKQDSSQPTADTELGHKPTKKESTGDIDYFEKFTLLDEAVPGEQAPELQEEAEQPAVKPQAEEQKLARETVTDRPSALEDSFVFVTDVEIVGEHLDEVFYGEGPPAHVLKQRDDDEADGGARIRTRQDSQRSMKESGSVLFGSEETILTPIYISPGPPKIIDPILLEEPTAMSFMYSDLYEDAVGERRKSDEEYSEAESVTSEQTYKRCLSDSEETEGYLEKFILKDETPNVEVQPESVEDMGEGRTVWSQSKFEMTGCLTRVVKEEDEDKAKTQEVSAGDRSEGLQTAKLEEKRETVAETEEEREEIQLSMVTEEQAVREASEESIQGSKLTEDQLDDQEVKHDIERDQSEPPESSTDDQLPEIQAVDRKLESQSEEHQREEQKKKDIETEQPCWAEKVEEKTAEEPVKATEETTVKAPINSEVPQMEIKSEIKTETTDKNLYTEAATDTQVVAPDKQVAAEVKPVALVEVKEPETIRKEMVTSTEPSGGMGTSAEISLCEEKPVALVEVKEPESIRKEMVTSTEPSGGMGTSAEISLLEDKPVALVEVKEPEIIRKEILTSTEPSGGMGTSAEISLCEEKPVALVKVKEPETIRKEMVTSTEPSGGMGTSAEISLCEEKPVALVEVKEPESIRKEMVTSTEPSGGMGTSAEISLLEVKPVALVEVNEPEIIRKEILTSTEPSGGMGTSAKISLCEEKPVALVEVKEPEIIRKEILTSTEPSGGMGTSAEISLCEEKPVALVEVKEPESIRKEMVTSTEPSGGMGTSAEISLLEDKPVALVKVKEPEIIRKEILTSTEPSGGMGTSAEISLCEEKVAAEVVPDDVAPVEIVTNSDSGVDTVVDVTEKAQNEKEIQTKVQIDLQEATRIETTNFQTAASEGEKEHVALKGETAAESQLPEFIAKAYQESEVQNEISTEVTEPVMPEDIKTDLEERQHEILETLQYQQEESVTDGEPSKTELITEDKTKELSEDTGTVQEVADVSDELVLLVPKGQAVEMDIDISHCSDKTTSDAKVLLEPNSTSEHLIAREDTPPTMEGAKTEPQLKVEPEVAPKVEELPRNYLDREYSPTAPVEEADTEEKKTEEDLEKDEFVYSPLRSFTPPEDLSGLHSEDILKEEADVEQKVEMHKVEDALEAIIKGDVGPDIDLHREDIGQRIEQDEMVAEAPEEPVVELEYEVISKQDAEEMPEPGIQRYAEESRPEPGEDREERMEMEMEGKVFDLSPEEDLIEADYEIIDAEEENQARLAAELQGMDWFCLTCGCLLSEDNCMSGDHHSHEVTSVDKAYEDIKETLGDWISVLQGRSENIEDLVSELELAYNSVEDQCVESEAAMQAQNEEMMALVMDQYNNMSVMMEEEKKVKLEQLYDQIVSFQESIDSTKATLETTAREAETDARSPEDIHARLRVALDSAMSLELGPKGLLVFEDYAKGNTSSSHLAQRKGIPVPQRPTLQPQEPGSATSTSVAVYWKVNPGDIIDCFQVYCMEDPQGAVSEEYRVTVKESYCVLEELEPDKTYKVWVMAVNYTGCSLPSERLAFTTAPSVPVIDTERCSVMWDSATLRWKKQTPGRSYTLEYCRQYELEGEGLRSISGIKTCEQRVLLQPNENYLFYIKAVNEAGASEQSEAALISTKGTRFHLLKASAHPALELSVDRTTLHYSKDTYENTTLRHKQCPSILGELLPARGHYYWETIVSGSTAYRLGVAYSTANRGGSLGENSLSWCLHCIPTPLGCRYQLLHNDVQSSVFVIEVPERVGTLLDYQLGRVSFYNAESGQLLGTFSQRFTQPCHPALALEMPGSLEVSMVLEVPEFTKDS